MKKFAVDGILDVDDNPFDRQERISWWSQEALSKTKVMVVGAGAIGNETLKNLALLGIGNIFIVDFDTISTSNLSRTVLFRKSDKERKKAEVAAERTRELCLAEDARVDWFHGDVVWELGTGVYREMDIVLGCLDNVETRFAVNRQCWVAETPWIDAGIYELGMHVCVYTPPTPPCYQCSASKEQLVAARQRYSCDDFKRAMVKEGKVPTVQVTSAIVSAIQVQEAIKLICGQKAAIGKKIYYQGKLNDFDVLQLPVNPACTAHVSYPEIISLPLSTATSLREFLRYVSHDQYSGVGATLDYSGDISQITFVVSVKCRSCSRVPIEFLRPSFRIYDTETICKSCQEKGLNLERVNAEVETDKVMIGQFSLSDTEDRILDLNLRDLGVPFLHVVAVKDQQENYKYYELSGDKTVILPNLAKKSANTAGI